MRNVFAVLTVGCVCAASGAGAPDYGFDWRTVGAPGNRNVTPEEAPNFLHRVFGRVDHVYRMTATEVTVGQWVEFVNAYAPYWTGALNDSTFTSRHINHNGTRFVADPGTDNLPADMSWNTAARYCNWLHNDKATHQGAFESGAYDTSTFTPVGVFPHTDQLTRSPGARFWIPSMSEWVKAVYYDPDRYGPGEGGYWLFPNSSDQPLVSGYPWEGGETSAGTWDRFSIPAGSYGLVRTPWGLLDASGGLMEHVEEVWSLTDRSRWAAGTDYFEQLHTSYDRLGFYPLATGGAGLRIASVPQPGGVAVIAGGVVVGCVWRARRRG